MSLIKCPECGKEFSDTAKACPNCGFTRRKRPIHKKNFFIPILILSIVVGVSVYFFLNQRVAQKPDNMSEAAYQAGVDALGIIDKYLNRELSEREACDELDRIDNLFISSNDDDMWRDNGIKVHILTAGLDIIHMTTPATLFETSEDKLKKIYATRDELAEYLNLEKKYQEYFVND